MKQTDNRQNKTHQFKPQAHPVFKGSPSGHTDQYLPSAEHAGGIVYGLIRDIFVATKIAQAAKHCHLAVHNFDKAEPLMAHAKDRRPKLVILDWDGCEAEAFKVLKEMNGNADLKSVPNVGYLPQSKATLRDEARRAGCHRVYTKTEFMKELEILIGRYAL